MPGRRAATARCCLGIAPKARAGWPRACTVRRAVVLRLLALTVALATAPLAARAQTVDDVVRSHAGGCTTAGVEGLSEQLVRSHLCAYPGSVAQFTPHPNITLTSSRVHPLGTTETVAAIRRAADRTPLTVTSAFRTLVEQYLLYHEGGCGLAAQPGRSNHQTGRAVDLSNYSAARSAMTGAGCTQSYPTDDPVHYDCPGADMRAASVLVFQRLWNENHPEDRIAEDGAYGPQTAARLGRSPAGGLGRDLCAPPPPLAQWGAEFVAQSFPLASADPIVLRPGEEVTGTIELRNVGTETWDAGTRLGTTEPRDRASAFAGPDWLGPNRAAAVEGAVPHGDTFPFTFTLRAPRELGEHRERFGVVQEGVTWFSDPGQLGPPDHLLEVRVLVVEGPAALLPSDAGVVEDEDAAAPAHADAALEAPDAGAGSGARPAALTGTCAAAPGRRTSGPLPWLLLLGIALRLRRRRSSAA